MVGSDHDVWFGKGGYPSAVELLGKDPSHSESDMAFRIAVRILEQETTDSDVAILARQYLKAVSEGGRYGKVASANT